MFCYVQLTAKKINLQCEMEQVNVKRMLIWDAPIFIVPIGLLVYLLNQGYSLPYVGFWSVMAIIALGLLSCLRKDFTLEPKQVLQGHLFQRRHRQPDSRHLRLSSAWWPPASR